MNNDSKEPTSMSQEPAYSYRELSEVYRRVVNDNVSLTERLAHARVEIAAYKKAMDVAEHELTGEQAAVLEHLLKYNTGNSGDSTVFTNRDIIGVLESRGLIDQGFKDNFSLMVWVATDTGRAALEKYRADNATTPNDDIDVEFATWMFECGYDYLKTRAQVGNTEMINAAIEAWKVRKGETNE